MADRVLMPRDDDGYVIESGEMWEAFQEAGADLLAMAPSPERDKAEVAFVRACGEVGWWEPWIEIMTGGELDSDKFSDYHRHFWAWAVSVGDESPRPYVSCWPRGGGKSSSVEFALLYWACLELRGYCIYVGAVQGKVEDNIEAVGELLLSDVTAKYYPKVATKFETSDGAKRDWRKKRIRTASGFTLDAFGMDQAMRGAKIGKLRPDVVVFDDCEDYDDSPKMTQKRIGVMTRKIIPMTGQNPIYLFAQNKIHDDSIMARMLDGRADFLNDRIVSGPIPQIYDMEIETETIVDENGNTRIVYQVVEGTPTWPDVLGIDASNRDLNREGLPAFMSEKQHETAVIEGDKFPTEHWTYSDTRPHNGMKYWRAWDLAGTEGGGDWTVGVLMGHHAKTGVFYVIDVVRGQWATGDVEDKIAETADSDAETYRDGSLSIAIEKQVAAAGKSWNERWVRDVLPGHPLKMVAAQGTKEYRADGYASMQQKGLVVLMTADWNHTFTREHAQFPDHGKHDDQVDAAALAFNQLSSTKRRKARVSTVAGASY